MHLSRFCPRVTVRRLMVAVAILSVLMWAERLRRLSSFYRDRAEIFALKKYTCSKIWI